MYYLILLIRLCCKHVTIHGYSYQFSLVTADNIALYYKYVRQSFTVTRVQFYELIKIIMYEVIVIKCMVCEEYTQMSSVDLQLSKMTAKVKFL